MKNIFVFSMINMSLLSLAHAQGVDETVEIERSRSVESLTVDLNAQTVRCLVGDYGASSLKISIPDMRRLTVFQHTTRGETQPCINAGPCRPGFAPDDGTVPGLDPSMILDPQKPTEEVELTIVLKEVLTMNANFKTCTRSLSETVNTKVRGLKFAHQDGAWLGNLDYEVCLKMKENEATQN